MSKSLFIITGPNRGLGLEIIRSFINSPLVTSCSSEFLLIGRNLEALKTTSTEISNLSPSSKVHQHAIDFTKLDDLQSQLETLYKPLDVLSFTAAYLINNAGSLGKLDKIPTFSVQDIRESIDANVTAPFALTSHFLKTFSGCPKKRVVNISSLAALQAFDCWSIYCVGKAARDMMHKCVGTESPSDGVKTVNYAPGPLDTDMQKEIREAMPDVPLKDAFVNMHRDGSLVPPRKSADVLTHLLIEDAWENGAHLDYYDLKKDN
eukprot:TRINITY_DN1672_c0_g1::TRINITY_DN1672_c0_g1_i1::g.17795::m.17795 TRINITY_DN1672_c0_g1::TRINITY_DN1672_c0_g1_i1::g.17795  ORF type:complete len:263 (+),score=57.07,sp/Q17QK8/SPRE_BOVIN/37.12/8e-43,adh_short/PF00106.20/1.5e-15,Nop/PF01798.13/0.16 TRINITY_DN1672_c0_g1_i1:43-831(+)